MTGWIERSDGLVLPSSVAGVELRCIGCGCTPSDACFDADTFETCSWSTTSPAVCSFCDLATAEPTEDDE